ncbi:MAG: alpha/beta hydrolase [Alphaproteobacteria bacterium]|nr:alpha/beta hydrolase [Alphaproteobacteria bacterium]
MENSKTIAYETTGLALDKAPLIVVWGHGWGHTRNVFRPFTEALAQCAAHLLLDFPGFGLSPPPPETWTTADYADAVAALIRPYRKGGKILYVGHSFGGRVGIQLAARHPDLVDALFLIGCAGLPRKRGPIGTLSVKARIYTFKTLKHLAPLFGLNVEKLRQKFGSADYRSAGVLRTLFIRIIAENLSEQARQIKCPTHFVYGANDADTPPEIGFRLQKLVKNSDIELLPNQDHHTVLGDGRHVVIKRLASFMEKLK